MRSKLIAAILILFASLVFQQSLVYTETVQPKLGRTGAPGEETCGSGSPCHNIATQPDPGIVTLTIFSEALNPTTLNSSFIYNLSSTYYITLTVDEPTSSLFGFEITALSSNHERIGNFSGAFPQTRIGFKNNREYVTHKNASGTNSWTFHWISPESDLGEVTFYYIVNTANGDEEPTGDRSYFGSFTIQSSGLVGIENPVKEFPLNFEIFPNPLVGNSLYINNELPEGKICSVEILDISGAIIDLPTAITFGEHHQFQQIKFLKKMQPGIYILRFISDSNIHNKKIIVA